MYPVRMSSHNWLISRIGNHMVGPRLPSLTGTVLDIGCGERPFEAGILHNADRYLRSNWPNTLHSLKADIVADANHPLPIRSASVDHAVSFEVLEHLAEPEVTLFAVCAGVPCSVAEGRCLAARPRSRP